MPLWTGPSPAAGVIRPRYSGASWTGTSRMRSSPSNRALADVRFGHRPSRPTVSLIRKPACVRPLKNTWEREPCALTGEGLEPSVTRRTHDGGVGCTRAAKEAPWLAPFVCVTFGACS